MKLSQGLTEKRLDWQCLWQGVSDNNIIRFSKHKRKKKVLQKNYNNSKRQIDIDFCYKWI